MGMHKKLYILCSLVVLFLCMNTAEAVITYGGVLFKLPNNLEGEKYFRSISGTKNERGLPYNDICKRGEDGEVVCFMSWTYNNKADVGYTLGFKFGIDGNRFVSQKGEQKEVISSEMIEKNIVEASPENGFPKVDEEGMVTKLTVKVYGGPYGSYIASDKNKYMNGDVGALITIELDSFGKGSVRIQRKETTDAHYGTKKICINTFDAIGVNGSLNPKSLGLLYAREHELSSQPPPKSTGTCAVS